MIQSACCYGSMTAGLHVSADPEKRLITVTVRANGLGEVVNRVFPADQYGEALDLYNEICAKMKEKYNSKEVSA